MFIVHIMNTSMESTAAVRTNTGAEGMKAGAMRESESCSHNCKECGSDCAERKSPQSMMEQPNSDARIIIQGIEELI